MPNLEEAHRLHSKEEPLMRGGSMYSLLDLMGATIHCDRCGAWQRLPTITTMGCDRLAAERGWSRGESDLCPNCARQSHYGA